jgi:hypothetical protein
MISAVRHEAKVSGRSRSGRPAITDHLFYIESWGQPKIVIDEDIGGVLELGREIQARAQERLLDDAISAIQTGKVVHFGPLSVMAGGLRLKGESLSWDEVESIELAFQIDTRSGWDWKTQIEDVVIHKAGMQEPWAVLPVSQVPNEFVLVKLDPENLSKLTTEIDLTTADMTKPPPKEET